MKELLKQREEGKLLSEIATGLKLDYDKLYEDSLKVKQKVKSKIVLDLSSPTFSTSSVRNSSSTFSQSNISVSTSPLKGVGVSTRSR
ncbi:MAG: hypothetical protein HY399_08300 [Elusimicrobia bacterium]|nr:hypothetical protein [Elusimicrobiota bacterium]